MHMLLEHTQLQQWHVNQHTPTSLKRVIVHISSTENFAPKGVMVIRDTADARETADSQLQLFLLLEEV